MEGPFLIFRQLRLERAIFSKIQIISYYKFFFFNHVGKNA